MNTQTNLDFGIETDSASDTEALTIKSANLITIRLVLNTANIDDLLNCLATTIKESNGYFDDEPVIIDANDVDTDIDWAALVKAIKSHKLMPAGFDAKGNNVKLAKTLGLAHFDLSIPVRSTKRATERSAPEATEAKVIQNDSGNVVAQKPSKSKVANATPETKQESKQNTDNLSSTQIASNQGTPTKIIERPLRSGQRIYAAGSDLIIIGMVSQGAEVIADGNIHVYGPLRGKAMAGAAGNTDAKIFTTQLEPELLAIAGVFKVFESSKDNPAHNQSAIVELKDNSLEIKNL